MGKKNSASWVSPKLVKSNERKKKEERQKSVLTMASYVCNRNVMQVVRTKRKNIYKHLCLCLYLVCPNTPRTRVGSGFRDRMLAEKVKKAPETLLHISSSYANIWGETKFQPREFPRSGSKAIDVEKERERKSVVCTCRLNQ